MNEPELLSIWQVGGWVFIGGGLGGLLDLLSRVEYSSKGIVFRDVQVSRKVGSFWLLLGVAFLIGAGGGLGVQWVMLGVGKFSAASSVENQFYLFTISVVAGYGARRLLPAITSRLEKELDEMSEEVEEVRQESRKALEEATESDLISRAISALGNDAPTFMRSSISHEMEDFLSSSEHNQKNRKIVILLARMLDAQNDLGAALTVIDRFLNLKETLGEYDKDYADVLYNRAAYKLRMSIHTQSEKEKEEAYENLERSIEIAPENKADAVSDKDFEHIWKEERFQKLGAP